MSVTLEDLQQYIDKEAIIHLKKDDGSLDEVTVTIKAATVAGVPFKRKGRADMELTSVDQIEEISAAPVKEKSVTQKVLKPIVLGGARQHLLDRHGVQLSWAKEATEQAAFEWHATLDHKDLGHRHEDKKETEREKALAAEAPAES